MNEPESARILQTGSLGLEYYHMTKIILAATLFCAFASAAYAAPPKDHTGPTKLTNTAMAQVNGGNGFEGFQDILEGARDASMGYTHEGVRDVLEGTVDIVHAATHH